LHARKKRIEFLLDLDITRLHQAWRRRLWQRAAMDSPRHATGVDDVAGIGQDVRVVSFGKADAALERRVAGFG
jgi:hypothetical protein